ncbi:hypothetical protein [Paenibacillus sp. FSL R5-0701]|uniref:hypothetical protein n=1 Tax=Paenibacillus sp. FSL R5-0701 TaxID=2921654 RepID=UPI0030CE446E
MKEPYVPIPMKMFAYETHYFASDDEFLVFFHIGRLVSARNPLVAIVNVELLHSIIQFDKTNDSRNKKRIVNAILGLQSKGYINIDPISDLKYTTYLEITLPHLDNNIYTTPVYSGGSNYRGYLSATDTMFTKTDSAREFKVLIYTAWRQNIKYSIPFSEWASVLGISSQTAVTLIETCREKGIISKQRGEYYTKPDGSIRQETNRYSVQTKNKDEWNSNKEMNKALKSMSSEQKSFETRTHNWFTDKYLDKDDMYVYLTTKCEILEEHALARIKGISKSPSGKAKMDKLYSLGMQKIQQEQQAMFVQDAVSTEQIRYILDSEIDDRHVQSWRENKERHGTTDYSYLLGND